MRVEELRIGNYFFIGGLERYVKVNALFLSHFKCTDENGIDFNNHQNNIKPIELTEEILLKCGFIWRNGYGYAINNLKGSIHKSVDNGLYEVFRYYDLRIEIKHLHQLQNLYFALTNEELNVNL